MRIVFRWNKFNTLPLGETLLQSKYYYHHEQKIGHPQKLYRIGLKHGQIRSPKGGRAHTGPTPPFPFSSALTSLGDSSHTIP